MNKYTKLLIVIVLIIITLGTILGFKRKRVELIMPNELITYTDASSSVDGYSLKDGEVKKYGNKLEVEYLSDPLGSGDNIKVELVYYSDDYPKTAVENLYNSDRERLMVYEDVTEAGEKAFIAFPSIFIYESGFYIKITAGSGSDGNQSMLLKELGQTAAKNLNNYLEKHKIK